MDKQEAKYGILIIVLNYLPTILIHCLFRPMWYKGVDSYTAATTMETMITVFILPVYLLVINYRLAKKFGQLTWAFTVNGLIIISCIWLSGYLHFKNWADSVGNLNNPDSETLAVIDFERTVGIVISLIGLIIIFVRITNMKNKAMND